MSLKVTTFSANGKPVLQLIGHFHSRYAVSLFNALRVKIGLNLQETTNTILWCG